jgi:hypothetical protein
MLLPVDEEASVALVLLPLLRHGTGEFAHLLRVQTFTELLLQLVGGNFVVVPFCPWRDVLLHEQWGYADYLAAIADPHHERHEELLEWRGPFDPEAFDAKKATKEMRKVT